MAGVCCFREGCLSDLGGHGKVAQILLSAGADSNASGWGSDALQAELACDNEEGAQVLLLDASSDEDNTERYRTALEAASVNGHGEVVQILLDAGADINSMGKFGTALIGTRHFGKKKVMQMLLDAGADVDDDTREYVQEEGWDLTKY